MDRILTWAEEADREECVGLLTARLGSARGVSGARRLRAEASRSHAEATPAEVAAAARRIRDRRRRPAGLWHSHGDFDVFHSAIDDDTVRRLLPAMAAWNYRSPPAAVSAPTATAADAAVLPLPDGRELAFSVVGPEIPGLGAREPAAWAAVATRFVPTSGRAVARNEGDRLILTGGGVRLELGVPDGCTVTTTVVESSPIRRAELYSLVVNRHGEAYAEVVEVWAAEGRTFVHAEPCRVEVVAGPKGEAGELAGADAEGAP